MKTKKRLIRFAALALCAALCMALAAGAYAAEEEEESGLPLYPRYEYYQADGMLKYYLDLTDGLTLHCFFRSGDPEYYEQVYDIDLGSIAMDGPVLTVGGISCEGYDISAWFESISIEFREDGALMSVVRDERTLAGGESDNLLTGVYFMEAAEVPETAEAPAVTGAYADYAYWNGYAYTLDDGQIKYRIEFGDEFLLHCFFRSGDPEYYEVVYTLYPDWDQPLPQGLAIRRVLDVNGSDITDRFVSLEFWFSTEDIVLMDVERDEKTLAGGADDNILTGEYTLVPCDEPFAAAPAAAVNDPAQLGALAQRYYGRNYGFFPPLADVTDNGDGTYLIHLYETVDNGDGTYHTATSAWYTVDASGVGVDEIMGTPIDLSE